MNKGCIVFILIHPLTFLLTVYPYPVTSTPGHDTAHHRPETDPAGDIPQNRAPRSYVYDADFFGSPNRGVPVYPIRQPSSGSPYRTLPSVKPKPLVSPNDDIQIPPPTYSRHPRIPNGLSNLSPRYDEVMRRKQKSEVCNVKLGIFMT